MNRGAICIFIFMIVLGLSEAGIAETKNDGNELLRVCESKNFFENGFCKGYIFGVQQVFRSYGRFGDVLCIDPMVQVSQSAKVVIKYLNNHPERLHEYDILLVKDALIEAFPCSKEQEK